MQKIARSLAVFAFTLGLALAASEGSAAPLPKSTRDMLKKFNLDPAVLSDLDQVLNVPKEWLDKAKQEKKLLVRGSPSTANELKILFGPFHERYPFIETDYAGYNRQGRTIRTLMAYKSGRVLADVVLSVGTFVTEFDKAGGLEDLRVLPAFKKVPDDLKDPEGKWVGANKNYWCISYNTNLVKREDLPREWDDLVTNPRWRGGNIALGNRPNLWVVNLWMVKGEQWAKSFLTRLFTEVKPQLRKEGMNSLVELVAAGEFHAIIPSNYKRPYQVQEKGAPVSFYCPDPAPGSTEETVILKGGNTASARIFLNWLLSKEGQIAQYAHEFAAPLDKELRPKLLPFADQIVGRKEAYRDMKLQDEIMPQLFDFWNKLWLQGGGSVR